MFLDEETVAARKEVEPKGIRQPTKWQDMPEMREAVLTRCHRHIIGNTLPGKPECEQIIAELRLERKWTAIKDLVRNTKVTNARKAAGKNTAAI